MRNLNTLEFEFYLCSKRGTIKWLAEYYIQSIIYTEESGI